MPHQPNVRPPAMGAFLLSRCFAPPVRCLVATLLSLCSQPYEERFDHDAPVSACVHAKVPALAKKLIFARFGYRVCGCITARMAFEGSMATMNVVHSRHRQFQRVCKIVCVSLANRGFTPEERRRTWRGDRAAAGGTRSRGRSWRSSASRPPMRPRRPCGRYSAPRSKRCSGPSSTPTWATPATTSRPRRPPTGATATPPRRSGRPPASSRYRSPGTATARSSRSRCPRAAQTSPTSSPA